jgi:hypothetical protein
MDEIEEIEIPDTFRRADFGKIVVFKLPPAKKYLNIRFNMDHDKLIHHITLYRGSEAFVHVTHLELLNSFYPYEYGQFDIKDPEDTKDIFVALYINGPEKFTWRERMDDKYFNDLKCVVTIKN